MIVINIHTFQLQYFDSILIRIVFAPITKGMVVAPDTDLRGGLSKHVRQSRIDGRQGRNLRTTPTIG